ncbi:MAG: hypothetical protein QW292_10290 [Candidatus Parvarchaeota archaeon]
MVDENCEKTVGELMEMMQNLEEDYPHRKFFFDGEMFAIVSEPKEDYVFIENQIIITKDLFRR